MRPTRDAVISVDAAAPSPPPFAPPPPPPIPWPPQTIFSWLGLRVTPLQAWQYFGAAVIETSNPVFCATDLPFLLHMLSHVRQQTVLLPMDVFFLVDPERGRCTGNPHITGRIGVYDLFAVLHACRMGRRQKEVQTMFELADVDSQFSLTCVHEFGG